MEDQQKPNQKRGLTSKIVHVFTTSQLSILFLIISLLAGAAALILTPREEDPQIVVPVMDILIEYPGASSEEVEKLAVTPLEVLLKQIEGVEYVYSVSRPGAAVVTVRYFVGQNYENSLIKTWDKLMSNQDIIPSGVTQWKVSPVEIDNVPIVLMTLSAQNNNYDSMALRRIADELIVSLRSVNDVGKSWVVGGEQRRVSIYANPARLAARGVTLLEVTQALANANVNLQAGHFERHNREILLEAGPHFSSSKDVGATIIKSVDGRVVYLRDVAHIEDGSADVNHYTRIGFGPAVDEMPTIGNATGNKPQAGQERQMVTIAVAKRKGSNAVNVAKSVIATAEELHGTLIPDDILLSITRDYGETANHKVNELIKHLSFAIVIIVVLLAFSLGPKEAFIVSIAVPMTLALTLLLDYMFGYTINRVTLFALILSLGLLVDDPIVDVENIHRHYKLGKESPLDALLTAVDEVRPPTILATFAVVVSFLPMFFITGMMGPYMAPMAFNVPVAMIISLIVAFTVTPWASYKLLRSDYHKRNHELPEEDLKETLIYRAYRASLGPLLEAPGRAKLFLLIVFVAFVGSVMLAATRAVPLKLLPFDNKNELQIIIDMPRGSTLEQTDEVARALGNYLATVNEVTDYQTYTGLASPMDFNGMVRQYYLRSGGYLGDVRINLLPKDMRVQQSHEIALRIRPEIERLGKKYGANLKIVEIPPGPPVLASLVAEIYGPPEASIENLVAVSKRVRVDMEKIEGVVDVDDFSVAPHDTVHFHLNREKAAISGVNVAQVAKTLRIAAAGERVGVVHQESERQPLEIMLQLPRSLRSSVPDLSALRVKNAQGDLIPLSEIVTVSIKSADQPIYHKNLQRVNYVTAEMAGRSPVEAVFDLNDVLAEQPLPEGFTAEFAGEGEWKITVDVFRDLGLAFAAALLMIYILLVGQTGSLTVPLVMMIAIPLTVIGIMPGFWLLNQFATPIAGYPNPIYFTATAMIGMIALAGIVVRNSIILIDFIERIRTRVNVTLADALIEAGAIRLRPIFLTAGAAMFGAFVIILDPIFSGLAWSFIFGIFASTLFSLLVIPVVYFLINKEA